MTAYLPDNSAGRNYWLLFITYLLVRWKYLTLSTESYAKQSSDSISKSACCHERHFVSTERGKMPFLNKKNYNNVAIK